MKIEELVLRRALDSRTNWTVEAEVNGEISLAPSGASTGKFEASCFVPENLSHIRDKISNEILGKDLSLSEFDQKLKEIDGTEGFENLGAVSIACSLAFKNAQGFEHKTSFPYPLSNVIGGGAHGGNTSIQEFLVIPLEAETFPEALETNAEIYKELKERYGQKIMGINDEGALITRMNDEETLEALKKVADKHGARIGLDVAASEFYEDGKYKYDSLDMELDSRRQKKFIKKLIEEYELVYVEDPFDQEDFDSHAELTKETENCLIVGDDLFTTNPSRLECGIRMDSGNSIIIKPNQIGTLTDTKKTVEKAKENNYVPVISHRSGETCDSTISDLALEWEIPIIKAGIADIRIAKLNKLLRLWYKMSREKDTEMNESLKLR